MHLYTFWKTTHYISNMSLQNFNNDDRLVNKKKSVVEDVKNLSNWARQYNSNYSEEIKEGTEKRRLLLTEGLKKGLRRDEINFGPKFIPSDETPLLNFLYFHRRDENYGEIEVLKDIKDVGKKEEFLREHYNKSISEGSVDGKLDKFESPNSQPNMGTLLYGDVTIEMFDKIKKLKSLSKSPNQEEAFSAYRKCLELCNKHGLEFDKIRCDVQ